MDDKGREERIRDFREWEYSLEGIHNALGELCRPCSSDVLTRTIFKLPRDVQDSIFKERPFFILAEGEYGFYFRECFPPNEEEVFRDFIFISLKHDQTEEFKQETVAHEIAHFMLKHGGGGPEVERAAADLTEKWGFGRT